MKVLFCGDIVGRAGRDAVIKEIPRLRRDLALDFVVVNGENAAAGFGITAKICAEFHEAGVDCITTGNHAWDQREIIPYIAQDKRLLVVQLTVAGRKLIRSLFPRHAANVAAAFAALTPAEQETLGKLAKKLGRAQADA